MTIGFTEHRAIDSIILPAATFYPTRIPRQHFELCNFISTSDPDLIYYASQSDIYVLNLAARKRKLIATLPWDPQCLAAGHGWVCVGGPDKGQCAFIDISEESSPGSDERAARRHAEVDALLPLDLDVDSRLNAHHYLSRLQGPSESGQRRQPEIRLHELGDSIVNSVTIFRLCSGKKGFQDETVAVLTNNDQNVTIYSLTQSRTLSTLVFPTNMNHASISPNGDLLVVAGDEPRAFFYRRSQLTSTALDGESVFAKYDWRIIAKPTLSATDADDACFATAFSPSGHICAVASQMGVITVFDTNMLGDNVDADKAVTDIFRSSRPCTVRHDLGAVRSMSFGPEPWDLLAWAEDRGRVCVTDLRNAFHSRQTIELDPEALSVERAHLPDVGATLSISEQRELDIEARFMREFLSGRADAVSHAADYMSLQAERRRSLYGRGQQEMRDSSPYDLSEAERQILDSLRQTRERVLERERAEAATQSPFSVNYLPSDSTPRASRDSDEVFSSSLPIPQGSRSTSLREYMRERNLERTRTHNDRSYEPRRRSSVVIPNSNATINAPSSHSSTLAPIGTGAPYFSVSPSRLPASTVVPSSLDPWQTISLAMSAVSRPDLTARARRDQPQTSATTRPQRAGLPEEVYEGLRDSRVNGEVDVNRYDVEIPNRLAALTTHSRVAGSRGDAGLGTMGLGWSGDGRNMYVATEEGIFEYTVNLPERKTFPGITLL